MCLLRSAPVLVFALAACAGGPRAAVMGAIDARDLGRSLDEYDRFHEDEGGGDPLLLGRVAALLLEEAVRGDDRALGDAALSQLEMAGTEADPVLERLAESAGEPAARARALAVLARRGSSRARETLRSMAGDDDPEVLASVATVLEPVEEMDRLLALLEHTGAAVRAQAAGRLEGAAPSGDARAALAEVARVDPVSRVRAAAVRALGAYGPGAFEPLRGRLSDPDAGVRMAAVGALVRADRGQALAAIGPLLEMAPNAAGVEAARVLAAAGGEGATTARAFLGRALRGGEANVRAQAAVALSSLDPGQALVAALLELLGDEQDSRVRLSVASILLGRAPARAAAKQALEDMMGGEGMDAVQAAAVLARHGADAQAVRVLAQAMREGEPAVRRAAARSLARDAMKPDLARTALRDEDALVRIHAAGAILSAASATS